MHKELPLEVYDTFGGYLCGLIGRIPEDDETFDVKMDEYVVHVTKTEGRRIVTTMVEVK